MLFSFLLIKSHYHFSGQADEVGVRFEKVHLDHVIVSPFDRCLETATRILKDKNVPIKVEPGLVEVSPICFLLVYHFL